MQIIDKNSYIAKLKADKYKDFIFRFCDMLEKKYKIKSILDLREYDDFKSLYLIFIFSGPNSGYPPEYDGIDYTKVDAHVACCHIIHDKNWIQPKKLIKENPATYRKIFNKMFKSLDPGFKLSIASFKRGNFETDSWQSFAEMNIALDLDAIHLHKI